MQIVTIHKSKGLEYPIVFCPFLWDGRRGGFTDGLDGVEYHDDAGAHGDRLAQGLRRRVRRADVQATRAGSRAPPKTMRLIYVALTRAVHRCVIVAGGYLQPGFGKTSATESTRSLLNWLVAGQGSRPQAWFDGKRDLAMPRSLRRGPRWRALRPGAGRRAVAPSVDPSRCRTTRPSADALGGA